MTIGSVAQRVWIIFPHVMKLEKKYNVITGTGQETICLWCANKSFNLKIL
jgi:hypothetical protein